jgi:hypothetical protein
MRERIFPETSKQEVTSLNRSETAATKYTMLIPQRQGEHLSNGLLDLSSRLIKGREILFEHSEGRTVYLSLKKTGKRKGQYHII